MSIHNQYNTQWDWKNEEAGVWWKTYFAIAAEASEGHLSSASLESRGGPATATGRWLRNRGRRVGGRRNARVCARRDRNRGRVASLRGAVSDRRRLVEAELDARLGIADRAAIGSKAVGAVGGHGHGAVSSVSSVGAARNCGKSWDDGGLAVYWCWRDRLGILRRGRRGRRGDDDGGLGATDDYRLLGSGLLGRTRSRGIRSCRSRGGGRRVGGLLVGSRRHMGNW